MREAQRQSQAQNRPDPLVQVCLLADKDLGVLGNIDHGKGDVGVDQCQSFDSAFDSIDLEIHLCMRCLGPVPLPHWKLVKEVPDRDGGAVVESWELVGLSTEQLVSAFEDDRVRLLLESRSGHNVDQRHLGNGCDRCYP